MSGASGRTGGEMLAGFKKPPQEPEQSNKLREFLSRHWRAVTGTVVTTAGSAITIGSLGYPDSPLFPVGLGVSALGVFVIGEEKLTKKVAAVALSFALVGAVVGGRHALDTIEKVGKERAEAAKAAPIQLNKDSLVKAGDVYCADRKGTFIVAPNTAMTCE